MPINVHFYFKMCPVVIQTVTFFHFGFDKETSLPDGKYNLRRLKRRRIKILHITEDMILVSRSPDHTGSVPPW